MADHMRPSTEDTILAWLDPDLPLHDGALPERLRRPLVRLRDSRLGVISKADRSVILQGLAKLDFGYARELAARIEATKCPTCGGDGFAEYVGGDDDDDACSACDGLGFR